MILWWIGNAVLALVALPIVGLHHRLAGPRRRGHRPPGIEPQLKPYQRNGGSSSAASRSGLLARTGAGRPSRTLHATTRATVARGRRGSGGPPGAGSSHHWSSIHPSILDVGRSHRGQHAAARLHQLETLRSLHKAATGALVSSRTSTPRTCGGRWPMPRRRPPRPRRRARPARRPASEEDRAVVIAAREGRDGPVVRTIDRRLHQAAGADEAPSPPGASRMSVHAGPSANGGRRRPAQMPAGGQDPTHRIGDGVGVGAELGQAVRAGRHGRRPVSPQWRQRTVASGSSTRSTRQSGHTTRSAGHDFRHDGHERFKSRRQRARLHT